MSVLIGTPLDDTLFGDDVSDNTIYGDATDVLPLGTTGGNDRLAGGSNSTNLLSGDAEHLRGVGLPGPVGGADVLTGGESATNRMFGDASGSFEAARGGDDALTGGNDSVNIMSGDAGGDLKFVIPTRGFVPSFGGNDTLVGGARSANTMFGDAAGTLESSFGGNDTLIAGDGGTNTLIGDALVLAGEFGSSIGGVDLLVSGTGTDDMWGDGEQLLGDSIGGADVFRFLADNGDDTIHDFERGKDLIDVSALVSSLVSTSGAASQQLAAVEFPLVPGLAIEERDVDEDGKTDSVIHFDDENSVTVLAVTGLADADFLTTGGPSYVLFSRTSTAPRTRDKWVGSEANSLPSDTPGSSVARSAFDADTATGFGTVLAGPAAADYAADGVLTNANVAMFDLTEAPLGVFATGAPDDLSARIAAGTRFFGTANTDLDAAHSKIDLAAGKLHLAQTDKDWNGVKNLEISLASLTSLREIRLENFVDTRLKLGDSFPNPNGPEGADFDIQVLGAKRGEVDASHAPSAIELTLNVWTNSPGSQQSFDIQGSIFNDVATIGPGIVNGFPLVGRRVDDPPQYIPSDPDHDPQYTGIFTTVFANLGAGDDQYDTFTDFTTLEGFKVGEFILRDVVWGGSGTDIIRTGYGNDRLFGDNGSGAWLDRDPLQVGDLPGDDELHAGAGADWIEGNAGTDRIDCGTVNLGKPDFLDVPDGSRDVVNFNFGDGFDIVSNFEAGIDVLRIANIGALQIHTVDLSPGLVGTIIRNDAGTVVLVGGFFALGQSVQDGYLLLS